MDLGQVPATFIRAPYISEAEDEGDLLKHQGKIVAARYRNQIGLSFHPEVGMRMTAFILIS